MSEPPKPAEATGTSAEKTKAPEKPEVSKKAEMPAKAPAADKPPSGQKSGTSSDGGQPAETTQKTKPTPAEKTTDQKPQADKSTDQKTGGKKSETEKTRLTKTKPDKTKPQKTKKPEPLRKPKPRKQPPTAEQRERRKTILRFALFVVVGAGLTVLLYVVLSALIPRWWSQTVARQVDGRISTGILLGLVYGFAFTFLPLVVLAQARHRAFGWQVKGAIVLAAVLLTAPNLMTLGIAAGNGEAAQAAGQTMDLAAPGFRSATVWGVVLGALAAVLAVTFSILWEHRTRELLLLRAQLEDIKRELPVSIPRPPDPTKD